MKRLNLLLLVSGLLLVAGLVVPVSASPSRLNQEVTDVDCVTNPDDESCPPVVQTVHVNDGRPIIIGVYSSSGSTQLRATLNGVTYVLGVDSQLSANGDDWTLDFSDMADALAPGSYTILVESLNIQGEWISSTKTFTVSKPDDGTPPTDEPGGGGAPGGGTTTAPPKDIGGLLGETGQPVVWALIASVVLMVGSGVLLILQRRKKKQDK